MAWGPGASPKSVNNDDSWLDNSDLGFYTPEMLKKQLIIDENTALCNDPEAYRCTNDDYSEDDYSEGDYSEVSPCDGMDNDYLEVPCDDKVQFNSYNKDKCLQKVGEKDAVKEFLCHSNSKPDGQIGSIVADGDNFILGKNTKSPVKIKGFRVSCKSSRWQTKNTGYTGVVVYDIGRCCGRSWNSAGADATCKKIHSYCQSMRNGYAIIYDRSALNNLKGSMHSRTVQKFFWRP